MHEIAVSAGGLVARDVMTRQLATVGEDASLAEALRVMQRWGVRHLPVTGRERFVGLLDDRLASHALMAGTDADHDLAQRVRDVMSRYVPQVGPDTALPRVARLLLASRSDAVAVIDEQEHLLGLITLVDVVGALCQPEDVLLTARRDASTTRREDGVDETLTRDRATWQGLFEQISQGRNGELVTIEVLGEDLGDQTEAVRLPLVSMSYDESSEVIVVALGSRHADRSVVFRHFIRHPTSIDILEQRDGALVLRMVGRDEVQTLISVRPEERSGP